MGCMSWSSVRRVVSANSELEDCIKWSLAGGTVSADLNLARLCQLNLSWEDCFSWSLTERARMCRSQTARACFSWYPADRLVSAIPIWRKIYQLTCSWSVDPTACRTVSADPRWTGMYQPFPNWQACIWCFPAVRLVSADPQRIGTCQLTKLAVLYQLVHSEQGCISCASLTGPNQPPAD
jgi:hypothetical protein